MKDAPFDDNNLQTLETILIDIIMQNMFLGIAVVLFSAY